MMEKVLIIGCPGAGKSTFARKLRDETGLPLHYLDMLWHRPDRTNLSPEEFDARLAGILEGERWIIDGNYLRTLETRLRRRLERRIRRGLCRAGRPPGRTSRDTGGTPGAAGRNRTDDGDPEGQLYGHGTGPDS